MATCNQSRFNLYLAVIAANAGAFSLGSLYSWPYRALPNVMAAESWLQVEEDEDSWISFFIVIGLIFGPLIGGILVDAIGRKGSMITAVLTGQLAWTTLYFLDYDWHKYMFGIIRVLGGGIICTCVPLYIAEIAEDDVRSALGSSFNFFFSAGYFLIPILSPPYNYWKLIIVYYVAPVTFFIMCPFIPESPYYYILKDDVKNAHKSLLKLRKGCSSNIIEVELDMMKESVQQSMKEKGTLLELISTKANRKALMLSCGAMIFQQLSGINTILFYSETILDNAGSVVFYYKNAAIVTGVILIAFAGIVMPLTKTFGIKNMMIISATGMLIFQTFTGLYFFLLHTQTDFSSVKWLLIIVGLVGYVIPYSCGFGPLPTAVQGEVFAPNVKGISSGVTVACSWGLSFAVTKYFPQINVKFGTGTVFLCFYASCVLAVLFSVFLVIDTREMSLQDIQDVLNNRKMKSTTKKHNSLEKIDAVA